MNLDNDLILEKTCIELMVQVYNATPIDKLNAWGMERYSRFKTKVWKHLEETTTLNAFLARYFAMFPMHIDAVLKNFDTINNKQEVYEYLGENLAIIIGRMQRIIKQTKTNPDEEEIEKIKKAFEVKEPKKKASKKDKIKDIENQQETLF